MRIVILGSCSNCPYEITVPEKIPQLWNTENGYLEATKKFYPAIDKSDLVIVIMKSDKTIGEHTKRDLEYANLKNKKVVFII